MTLTASLGPNGPKEKHFVRYDPKTGAVLSFGHMHIDMIELFRKKGESMLVVDGPASLDGHAVVDGKLVQRKAAPRPGLDAARLRSMISGELVRTDHYVVPDIAEDMTDEQRQQWREYRQQLKSAFRLSDVQAMQAALPAKAPDDVDPFERVRVATGTT